MGLNVLPQRCRPFGATSKYVALRSGPERTYALSSPDCWISSRLIAPNRSWTQCFCCGRLRSVLSLVFSYALRCPWCVKRPRKCASNCRSSCGWTSITLKELRQGKLRCIGHRVQLWRLGVDMPSPTNPPCAEAQPSSGR